MVRAEAENGLIERKYILCEVSLPVCILIFIPSSLCKDLISDKFSFRAVCRTVSVNSPFSFLTDYNIFFFFSFYVLYINVMCITELHGLQINIDYKCWWQPFIGHNYLKLSVQAFIRKHVFLAQFKTKYPIICISDFLDKFSSSCVCHYMSLFVKRSRFSVGHLTIRRVDVGAVMHVISLDSMSVTAWGSFRARRSWQTSPHSQTSWNQTNTAADSFGNW